MTEKMLRRSFVVLLVSMAAAIGSTCGAEGQENADQFPCQKWVGISICFGLVAPAPPETFTERFLRAGQHYSDLNSLGELTVELREGNWRHLRKAVKGFCGKKRCDNTAPEEVGLLMFSDENLNLIIQDNIVDCIKVRSDRTFFNQNRERIDFRMIVAALDILIERNALHTELPLADGEIQ